ncbi:hypothetical protein KM043_001252 [Ampulex compressa]|nr:hypothetical protein KM043_001252 [Ampulex compressa]
MPGGESISLRTARTEGVPFPTVEGPRHVWRCSSDPRSSRKRLTLRTVLAPGLERSHDVFLELARKAADSTAKVGFDSHPQTDDEGLGHRSSVLEPPAPSASAPSRLRTTCKQATGNTLSGTRDDLDRTRGMFRFRLLVTSRTDRLRTEG